MSRPPCRCLPSCSPFEGIDKKSQGWQPYSEPVISLFLVGMQYYRGLWRAAWGPAAVNLYSTGPHLIVRYKKIPVAICRRYTTFIISFAIAPVRSLPSSSARPDCPPRLSRIFLSRASHATSAVGLICFPFSQLIKGLLVEIPPSPPNDIDYCAPSPPPFIPRVPS